ncbi:DNA-directed RNA polymerase subunit omega [candidate division KSB1 bacterium]|nr:DNA-directed RNA polymerase subunit omega [candidate division KSB1 bacterium]
MVTTIKLDELTANTITLYEAVMVVAKRARQINNEERAKMDLNLGTDEVEEEFDEFPLEIQSQVFDRKIKPTKQAIRELIEGEINITRRVDKEEVEDEEEEK